MSPKKPFELTAPFEPFGDQPAAIAELSDGLRRGDSFQTLLGVTGSGKTFTISNVIQEIGKPTLVMSHNKTLAAQLYAEFKQFFPNNAVEFFISYYDYYQPEAYIASSDTYIEKDLSINDRIDRLRLRATSALVSGRTDIIIVASVSCIYGLGSPEEYRAQLVQIQTGQRIARNELLSQLVGTYYRRHNTEFTPGSFRVRGDVVDGGKDNLREPMARAYSRNARSLAMDAPKRPVEQRGGGLRDGIRRSRASHRGKGGTRGYAEVAASVRGAQTPRPRGKARSERAVAARGGSSRGGGFWIDTGSLSASIAAALPG